jgi:hypothetical protein
LPHDLPHMPQLLGSELVDVHAPEQHTSPEAQGRVGLLLPGATGTHVPGMLGVLHATHMSLHRVAQQTASEQKSVVHSPSAPHAVPVDLVGRQVPLAISQYMPEAHCAATVHGAHVPALQKPLAHSSPVVQPDASPPASGVGVLPESPPSLPIPPPESTPASAGEPVSAVASESSWPPSPPLPPWEVNAEPPHARRSEHPQNMRHATAARPAAKIMFKNWNVARAGTRTDWQR